MINTRKLADMVSQRIQTERNTLPIHLTADRKVHFRNVCKRVYQEENVPSDAWPECSKAIGQILGIRSGIAKRSGKKKAKVADIPAEPLQPKPLFTKKQIRRMKGESLSNINRRKDYLLSDP